MNWESIYLICFGIGLVLSILSFAGGFAHLHLGHIRFGHSHLAHTPVHPHTGRGSISPFNGFTMMAFLCWFGGAGYLLVHNSPFVAPIVFLLAVLAGIAGAAIIFGFLVKVLLPRERLLLPEDTELRGVLARVSSTLHPSGTGEVIFSLNGTRQCAAARSEDGQPLARDTQVLILRYEQGIAWVRPWTELDDLDSPRSPT